MQNINLYQKCYADYENTTLMQHTALIIELEARNI